MAAWIAGYLTDPADLAIGFVLSTVLGTVLMALWITDVIKSALVQLVLIGSYLAVVQALAASSDALTWFDVAVIAGVAISVVLLTEFWRRWISWKTWEADERTFSVIVGTVGGFLILVVFFSTLNSVFLTEEISKSKPVGELAKKNPGSEPDLVHVEEHYVWHFLDAVPALKLPQTLNWRLDYKLTDRWSGLMLLFFKLLAILPVIAVSKFLYDRAKRTGQPAT